MPTVSVVIPAYNAERWIGETLESVLAQEAPDLEVLVVDDGSTDDTAAVVARFPSVRCLRKPNGGLGSARNAGIRAATGRYVAFVDSDDVWLPGKLSAQIDLLDRTGLAWAYCDAIVFDEVTGRKLHRMSERNPMPSGDVLETLFLGCFIASPTPVVRRSVFDEVGLFSEVGIVHMREDWDMWLRIAARYPVGLVPHALARYRTHPSNNTSRESPALVYDSTIAVIESACQRDPARLQPLRDRAVANLSVSVGRLCARRGDLSRARSLFRQAIRLGRRDPQPFLYWAASMVGSWPLRGAIRVRHWLRRQRYRFDVE